ncbi:MAG: alpha/beta fold hydrolase [Desulfuromonadales bacterium]|nr:alpha/beta fold hydrolase [Desulfuromonadales bacterium]
MNVDITNSQYATLQHRNLLRIRAFALIIFHMLITTATTVSTAGASAPSQERTNTPANTAQDSRELVVVLHGLGRTNASMWRITRALEHSGYRVVSCTYPSRTMPAEEIASKWLPQLLAENNAATAPRVHFVTHSLGGIIVRLWLRDCGAPANMGRIVMIAPPNHGSEIPDHLGHNPFFRFFTGINGMRLGTSPDSLPCSLGALPPHVELGIIAGNRSLNPLFSSWIPGPDDGKVSVASTKLEGMCDHIVMPYSHTWLTIRSAVIEKIIAFLHDGKFKAAE